MAEMSTDTLNNRRHAIRVRLGELRDTEYTFADEDALREALADAKVSALAGSPDALKVAEKAWSDGLAQNAPPKPDASKTAPRAESLSQS